MRNKSDNDNNNKIKIDNKDNDNKMIMKIIKIKATPFNMRRTSKCGTNQRIEHILTVVKLKYI